jgi:hypothetical protein
MAARYLSQTLLGVASSDAANPVTASLGRPTRCRPVRSFHGCSVAAKRELLLFSEAVMV